MGDEKEVGKLPTRHQLKEDWEEFLDKEEWLRLYDEAMNDKQQNSWMISQTIFKRYIEKYDLPKTVKTTGNNQNFDEAFEMIATETLDKGYNIEKFQNLCQRELITLSLAMELMFPNLKR